MLFSCMDNFYMLLIHFFKFTLSFFKFIFIKLFQIIVEIQDDYKIIKKEKYCIYNEGLTETVYLLVIFKKKNEEEGNSASLIYEVTIDAICRFIHSFYFTFSIRAETFQEL